MIFQESGVGVLSPRPAASGRAPRQSQTRWGAYARSAAGMGFLGLFQEKGLKRFVMVDLIKTLHRSGLCHGAREGLGKFFSVGGLRSAAGGRRGGGVNVQVVDEFLGVFLLLFIGFGHVVLIGLQRFIVEAHKNREVV